MEEYRYKILIVDDESSFREPLGRCLRRRLKASFSEIDNGPDAIETIRKIHYDLVILDIGITGCDGWEVIRSVREFNKDIKFIVISGNAALSEENKKVIAEQTCGFIKKPVTDLPGLVRQVSYILGGDIIAEFTLAEVHDYKGRPEVRNVIHAFENLFNNIEANSQGFIEDCHDDIFKDKSKEEVIVEVVQIMERLRRLVRTRNQLYEILRKI